MITGARRGIGRATVEVFAGQGANIWACARCKDDSFSSEMSSLSRKYGVSIWPMHFDITDKREMRDAVKVIREQKADVHVLVNTAGIAADSTSFYMTSIEKMRMVLDVNFLGQTLLIQYVSRLMARAGGGSIVNVASVAGLDGEPAQYEYVASKAAVIGATKSLARELARDGIRVNAVAPGMTDTDMGNQIDAGLRDRVLSKVIMGRMARPEEIANAIAFLASDMSSYITGQIFRVDGGM